MHRTHSVWACVVTTTLVFVVPIRAQVDPQKPDADDPAAAIKKLVPAATGMPLKDWDKLATAHTAPKPADLESKALSLMLISLKITDDEKAREEFRYVTERPPKPFQIAKEITRSVRGNGRLRVALGPVTMIHADRITDFTCEVESDTATGTVSFKVPELYQGKVNYVARKKDDKWRIEEFSMPANSIHIVLPKDGKWVQK